MPEKRYWLKRKSRRKPHRQNTLVVHMLPNMVTLVGLCFGVSAIKAGLDGQWEKACYGILAAYIIDGVDGMLARLLKAASPLGAELDSLADMVNFGVAPAILIHCYGVQYASPIIWAIPLFYVMCVALRLARFNTTPSEPLMQGFFQGVPSTTASVIALTPIVLHQFFKIDSFIQPKFLGAWMCALSLLVISKIPTFSLKGLALRKKVRRIFVIITCSLIALLYTRPWCVYIVTVILYIATIPMTFYAHRKRLQRKTPPST